MIFILHYILFASGTPSTVSLLAIFLQTYSVASLTQIGTLLMVLPFVSILVKPLFCAIADRQQAHKQYLMGTLLMSSLGYGSLVLVPTFFARWSQQHGQLVWYMDIVGVVLGFSAFAVAWSLGDALAVNAAQMRGIPWGFYRAWATLSWGVFGWLTGQVNEVSFLPKYVPGLLIFVGATWLDLILLSLWPNRDFDMSAGMLEKQRRSGAALEPKQCLGGAPEAATPTKFGTLNSRDDQYGSVARLNPRVMAALAKMAVGELGNSIKSSIRSRNQDSKVMDLAELVARHDSQAAKGCELEEASNGELSLKVDPSSITQPAASKLHGDGIPSDAASLGRSAWRRAQLTFGNMNSLSSASGLAIAEQVKREAAMQSTCDAVVLGDVAKEPHLEVGLPSKPSLDDLNQIKFNHNKQTEQIHNNNDNVEDIQLVLLKIIVKRDRCIWKYLIVFTVFGVLLYVHLIYFFMHLKLIAKQQDCEFSKVAGFVFVAHAASEIFTFTVLGQHYVPRVGPLVSLLTVGLLFALRYLYYATYFAHYSPYMVIITETFHGFAYGIVYTLITTIANDCVDKLDQYLPELIERQIVSPSVDPNSLKLPLRATMQGVFSGAFDGLGQGIGALMAGIYLDYNPYESLWMLCTCISLLFLVVYPLTEWFSKRRS